MRKLFLILLLVMISVSVHAQVEKVTQVDSIKSGRTSNTFTINSRHNYNTIMLKNLASTDSLRVWHITENNDTAAVALRDLNTWTDLTDNKISNVSGAHEFLILHPNLYKVWVQYKNSSISKTIPVRRRGNNLK